MATEGPRPSGSRRRRPAARLVIVGLLALVLGAGAVGANLLDPVDATPVVAEPADSAGDDPFTPPTPGGAGSGSAPPAGGGSAPDTEGGAPAEDVPVDGDTEGLYGGTGADACSAASMARFFDTHPDRAAAWARAQGIQPDDIRSFLRSLTAVVLRTDTAVTNHGFRDGRANAYQAVLQAGTAVMVDEYGVPRVRCACGNPLDAPGERDQVRYTGETWSELGERPVTVIEPAPATVEHFVVVVQQDTTVVVERPVGSDGNDDAPAAPEDVEAALDFSVEDPANAGSGEDAIADGPAGSGEEPATDGSTGTAEEPAMDGSDGTGGDAARDGSAGAGEEPATDASAGTGGEPGTDGSTGTGGEPGTDGSTGTGGEPGTDASAGAGGDPATDGATGTGGEPGTDGSTGTGGDPGTDASAGTGGEPGTDASAGTGGEPGTDASAGTGGEPGTDASAGAGGEPGTDASAGTGGEAGTDGSTGTGGDPATDASARAGGDPDIEGSAGTGEVPATDESAGSGGA